MPLELCRRHFDCRGGGGGQRGGWQRKGLRRGLFLLILSAAVHQYIPPFLRKCKPLGPFSSSSSSSSSSYIAFTGQGPKAKEGRGEFSRIRLQFCAPFSVSGAGCRCGLAFPAKKTTTAQPKKVSSSLPLVVVNNTSSSFPYSSPFFHANKLNSLSFARQFSGSVGHLKKISMPSNCANVYFFPYLPSSQN